MGSSGKSPENEERSLFEQAVQGVVPLAESRSRVAARKQRPRRGEPARRAAPVKFVIERHGERVEGLAPDADRRQLLRLERGELPVEMRLDLHGYTEDEARRAVLDALERAARRALRCLLIVHGRGLRSAAGPVLKEALPGWLSQSPRGRRVLAFTSARPAQGGAGATLVLLRKQRASS